MPWPPGTTCANLHWNRFIHFYRAMLSIARTMLSHDALLTVCPSVCPSIPLSHAGILSKRPNISSYSFNVQQPHHYSFSISNGMDIVRLGVECKGGLKKSRFSANISLFLGNDTRESHSYYGMRIRNRIQAFKWCHFQWPWTASNQDFKVTPLFDAEYLINGSRYIVTMEY